MKKLICTILLLICYFGFSQNADPRISNIKHQLEILEVDNPGLTEQAKTDINVTNITLSNFILAISNAHGVNINVAPELNQTSISNNNFSNVTVSDLLVFLCKEYSLTIDFTGSILSIKKYVEPAIPPKERFIPVAYNPDNSTISIDAKNDKLYDVFKRIIDESAKNLVFAPEMGNKTLTSYIKNMPFDAAMDKLALANNLYVEKTKDNFYVFEEENTSSTDGNNSSHSRLKTSTESKSYKILDLDSKLLEVNFNNTPIATIINDIGNDLGINIFTATPLDKAGKITFKTKSITFDDLLVKMFESLTTLSNTTPQKNTTPSSAQNNRDIRQKNTSLPASSKTAIGTFTFKKEGNTYFFGTKNQLSTRRVEIIPLMYRSVELLADPSGGSGRSRSFSGGYGNNSYGNYNNSYSSFNTNSYNNPYNNNTTGGIGNTNRNINRNNQQSSISSGSNFNSQSNSGNAQDLIDKVPDEVKGGLNITTDYELNSFYVVGASSDIERFKRFIKKIDKPVPVVLIELMIIEVNRSATVETGVSWGIADSETTTQGGIFPETDLTLGSSTINKVIGGFDGIGSFNLGKVVPEFFASIKALETNGNIKIRSTPKLATLNGHKATLSNGQTSYYAVTQRNIYGTDNPQTSEITNYQAIDAELGLTIKPIVSGNGQVTLDIYVVQSSFGTRIAEDAPPDLNSREFTSIMRVKDQDIVLLGGLEEKVKNDSGSGVPLLARIPVIKWLFSKRTRQDSKSKLSILIKPTVIY